MKAREVSIICLSLVILKVHGNFKIECSCQQGAKAHFFFPLKSIYKGKSGKLLGPAVTRQAITSRGGGQMGKTLRQVEVSRDSSQRVPEAWGFLGTSFIPAQVSDCLQGCEGNKASEEQPGGWLFRSIRGEHREPYGVLAPRHGEAEGFLAKRAP